MFVLPSLFSLLQCTELGISGLGICETVLYDRALNKSSLTNLAANQSTDAHFSKVVVYPNLVGPI